MKKYDEILNKGWEKYDALTDTVSEMAFAEVVRPFCVKRGLRFLAGNGTYWIGCESGSGQSIYPWEVEDDEEFQAIFDLLDTEIPGMPANSLGTIMPDYTPPNGEK